ncbi:MAG: hypothetical protein ACP5D7_20950 [Limnospira sp.]
MTRLGQRRSPSGWGRSMGRDISTVKGRLRWQTEPVWSQGKNGAIAGLDFTAFDWRCRIQTGPEKLMRSSKLTGLLI